MTTPTLDTPEQDAFHTLRLTIRTLRNNPDDVAARLAAAHTALDYLALMFGDGEGLADAA